MCSVSSIGDVQMYLKCVRWWQLILKGNKLWISRIMLKHLHKLDSLWHSLSQFSSIKTKLQLRCELSHHLCWCKLSEGVKCILVGGVKSIFCLIPCRVSSNKTSFHIFFVSVLMQRSRKRWNVRRNDDHWNDFVLRQDDSFIALVVALFMNTHSPGKSAISLLISPRQIIHFSFRREASGMEEKFGALRDSNIPDISFHHFSLWPWLNFTYHPKTYRSITR